MKSIRNHSIAALSLTLLLGAGLTLADGTKSDTEKQVEKQKDGENANQPPLLAGPKVEDAAKEPAGVSRMGEQMRPAQLPAIQLMQWMRLARSLDLADEQVEKIDAIAAAHRSAMRKFMEENSEALQAIQSQVREARQGQDRERMQELLGKSRELRQKGPRPERVQSAVWDVLTEAQQEALQEKIAELRQARQQRLRDRESQSSASEATTGETSSQSSSQSARDRASQARSQRSASGDRRATSGRQVRRGAAGVDQRSRQRANPGDPQQERPQRERRREAPRPD